MEDKDHRQPNLEVSNVASVKIELVDGTMVESFIGSHTFLRKSSGEEKYFDSGEFVSLMHKCPKLVAEGDRKWISVLLDCLKHFSILENQSVSISLSNRCSSSCSLENVLPITRSLCPKLA